MAGSNVEFRGKEGTLAGYRLHQERTDKPYFAIFCQKELRFSFATDDVDDAENYLSNVLDVLQSSQSQAIYTIRFYDELNKNGKIDNQTLHIGSFNFKVYDGQGYSQGQQLQPFMPTPNSAILEELKKINTRLDAVEADEIGEIDPDEKKQRFVMDLLALEPVQMIMSGIASNYFPNMRNRQQGPPQGMAGTGDTQEQKVQQAVNRLILADPKIGDHLLMFAALAEDSPGIYKKAIAKLEELI